MLKFYRRILLTVFVLVFTGIIFLSTNVTEAYGKIQPTATVAMVVPTITLTPQQPDAMQEIYQQVLDVSKSAVEEVHKTTNDVLSLVSVIFVALTLGGFGGAWLLSTFAKRASDKATLAQQNATEALEIIKRTAKKALELEKRNNDATKTTNELIQKQNELYLEIENAQKYLQVVKSELFQLKNDRKELKRPLTLILIDDYGMQLLGDNIDNRNSAISALIEMSTRSDSIVRRRTVKALGIMEEYDERVIKRLKEIIETDIAQGVRKEAEKSLKLLEAKKAKKTKGQNT